MKLNQDIRDKALAAALARAFSDREAAHKEQREALGNALHSHEHGDGEKIAEAMPEGWVNTTREIVIQHVDFERHSNSSTTKYTKEDATILLGRWRACPRHSPRVNVKDDHPMFRDFCTLAKSGDQLRKERAALESKIRTVLYSCNTVAQLKEVWPEGVPFLPVVEKKEKAMVPVSLVKELNKTLGLSGS